MTSTSIVILLTALSTAAGAAMKPMIVGGAPAEKGEFSFQVSLQEKSGAHFCGGSLIKKNWVLTAAHCVQDWAKKDKIVLGLNDLKDRAGTETFTANKVITHEKYNSNGTDYDIALIQLSGDSDFSPIELNTSEIEIPRLDSQEKIIVTAAGWGDTGQGHFPTLLQKVELPLVNSADCSSEKAYPGQITAQMICAGYQSGGKDSCQMDSGGPLFLTETSGYKKLVGVVSWGHGCALPDKFGVYAKVNSVIDWIAQQTQ